jgi:hypothetical protein
MGRPQLRDALNEVDLATIQLEPFLRPDVRDHFRDQVQGFMAFCLDARRGGQQTGAADKEIDQFLRYRNEFRATLYAALFS